MRTSIDMYTTGLSTYILPLFTTKAINKPISNIDVYACILLWLLRLLLMMLLLLYGFMYVYVKSFHYSVILKTSLHSRV